MKKSKFTEEKIAFALHARPHDQQTAPGLRRQALSGQRGHGSGTTIRGGTDTGSSESTARILSASAR